MNETTENPRETANIADDSDGYADKTARKQQKTDKRNLAVQRKLQEILKQKEEEDEETQPVQQPEPVKEPGPAPQHVAEPEPVHTETNFATDLNDLEKQIHAKVKQERETRAASQPAQRMPGKPRKADLIESLLKLQEHRPITEHHTYTWYRAKTVPELEKMLADQMGETIENIQNKPAQTMAEDAAKRAGVDPSTEKIKEMAGSALFQVCSVFCKTAELATINFEDKLGTSLEGFSADVNDNREVIEQCLREIYAENSQMLDQYLTPQNRLILTLGTLAVNRAAVNGANLHFKKTQRGASSVTIREVS